MCEGQNLKLLSNKAFQKLFNGLFLAQLQIYCVYSTANAQFTIAVSQKTCVNIFDYMPFSFPFPTRQLNQKLPRAVKMHLGGFFKLVLAGTVKLACSEMIGNDRIQHDIGCQHKSTSGRDYRGMANTTLSGIPCQRWSDTQPIDNELTYNYVGDHNFCRNPAGTEDEQV